MNAQKKLVFPNIAVKFPERFPKGHVNSAKGWNFSRTELAEGKMLTMDLDMPGKIACSLRCNHCFNPILRLMEKKGELLSESEIKELLIEAKTLGLRAIKIIGPGEPLENRILLPFLEFLVESGIQPLIFTRATALGDDRRAQAFHGMTSENLARILREVYDVSILLNVNSFDHETQAKIVQNKRYPKCRDRALELLVTAGFNEFLPGEPTSLAIIFNPITIDNADEVVEVYKWARRRNMYVVTSPTMISGLCREPEVYRAITPSENQLLQIYTEINVWAIKQGIFTFDDLERDGVASYAGSCPCQQVGSGLFVRRDGTVLRCPGDDISVQGKLSEQSISEIWFNSENYRVYRGKINVGCPPKEGKSFPENFFEKVLAEIRKHISPFFRRPSRA